MFVLTADQVDSRTSSDSVEAALTVIAAAAAGRLARPAERTVGDEVQAATEDAHCLLEIALALNRLGEWSIGCGAGGVEADLPQSIRAGRGPAFICAREAVDAAKKRPTRFALRAETATADAADAQALIDLLLTVRARRSDEGWEVFDLLGSDLTQKQIARQLGITDQAVSLRVRAAQVPLELEAVPALVHCLERVAGSAP